MVTGKIKTLYSDMEKTEALFPRTKVSAISDENGVGLDVLLENISSSGGSGSLPEHIDADTLEGYNADDFVLKSSMSEQINVINTRINNIDTRIDSAFTKIDTDIEALRQEILGGAW